MTDALPWILAAIALFATLVAGFRLRQVAMSLAASRHDGERLHAELQAARQQLEKATAKQRRAADELADLRKRLDKLRRREGKGGRAEPAPGAGASQAQHLERELEAARQARDSARSEASDLAAELSRLRAERSNAPPVVAPRLDDREIEALESRAASAVARITELEQQVKAGSKETERLRAKVRTQESLYASLRGELEAKKDRLRRQQEELERLQALKVAVLDPEPAPAAEDEPAPE